MPVTKLREFLDSHNIRYIVISHSVGYTAQGIAALTHIPGKELAKTVIVRLDGALVMAVLPASSQVDLSRNDRLSATFAGSEPHVGTETSGRYGGAIRNALRRAALVPYLQ